MRVGAGDADAATKALTVDSGLASIPDLLGLATDLGKVPSNRITFVTMPTTPDPSAGSAIPATVADHVRIGQYSMCEYVEFPLHLASCPARWFSVMDIARS